MTRTISLITAIAGLALATAVPALGKGYAQQQDFWNYDQQGQQVANTSPGLGSQDLASQYATLGVNESPIVSPDAVDRALATKRAQQLAIAGEGRSLSFDNYRVQTGATSAGRSLVFDNHRIEPVGNPTEVTVSSSGSDLEWPQMGLAFGLGIALILGLFLTVRLSNGRTLAH
jgi:hypothetical protein